jgi:hypothetical protein
MAPHEGRKDFFFSRQLGEPGGDASGVPMSNIAVGTGDFMITFKLLQSTDLRNAW